MRFVPPSGGASGLRVSKSGSAASLARFDFATKFAIEHQYLWQPRHRGDRTDYLHWLLAKQADGSEFVVRHSRVMYLQRPQRAARSVLMQAALERLCFSHISCSKKYGFVAGHPGRKRPDPTAVASRGKENVIDADRRSSLLCLCLNLL
jgi:hypothetical protein